MDQRVLRRRGLVIDTADIDARTAVQEEVGNGDRPRLMERLLTVSSSRVDERAVGVHECSQLVEPAKARRHVRRQFRTVPEKKSCGVLVGVVEHSVGAVLPVALQVHVGAGRDQRAQHRGVLRGDVRRPLAEGEHRIVDPFPDVRRRQEPLTAGNVAATHRVAERLDVAFLEVGDELRPRFETRFARDGKLRIGKMERSRRSGGVEPNCLDARERRGVAVTRCTNQILRELALLFEVDGKGGRVQRGHERPPSTGARVRIMG